MPVGWAPYRHGHWAHVMPWGWTWIDDALWGFVPFHYGRWAMLGGGWGWVPWDHSPAGIIHLARSYHEATPGVGS
jgi:hypothetical protein